METYEDEEKQKLLEKELDKNQDEYFYYVKREIDKKSSHESESEYCHSGSESKSDNEDDKEIFLDKFKNPEKFLLDKSIETFEELFLKIKEYQLDYILKVGHKYTHKNGVIIDIDNFTTKDPIFIVERGTKFSEIEKLTFSNIEKGKLSDNKAVIIGFNFTGMCIDYGRMNDSKKNGEWTVLEKKELDNSFFVSNKYGYKDDEFEGEHIWYYENGIKQMHEFFKNNENDGECIFYYKNGNIEFYELFKNYKAEGLSMEYYEDGKIKSIEIENKDISDGLVIIQYHENGKIKCIAFEESLKYDRQCIVSYEDVKIEFIESPGVPCIKYEKNGKIKCIELKTFFQPQMPSIEYYENGKKKSITLKEALKPHTQPIEYYEDGNKKSVELKLNSRLDKRCIEYYEDGETKRSVSFYQYDKPNGPCIEYDKNGNIEYKAFFKDGSIVVKSIYADNKAIDELDDSRYKHESSLFFENNTLLCHKCYDIESTENYLNKKSYKFLKESLEIVKNFKFFDEDSKKKHILKNKAYIKALILSKLEKEQFKIVQDIIKSEIKKIHDVKKQELIARERQNARDEIM